MFCNAVKLGFKDTIKNWRKLLVLSILIIATGSIIVSATASIIRNINKIEKISYSVVPISTDITELNGSDFELDEVYSKGGCSFFYSDELSKRMNCQVLVVIGMLETNSTNDYGWIIPADALDHLLKDEMGDIKKLTPESMNKETLDLLGLSWILTDESMALITFQNEQYKHLYNYDLNANERVFILENTSFTKTDLENGTVDDFENIFSDKSVFLKRMPSPVAEENDFIYRFIGAHGILLTAVILLFFVVFITDYYKKMRENYIIHLICGSTVKVVYGRMMTFVFILTGVVFLFMSATSFFDIRIIVPAAGFLVLMDIVLGIISYLLLRKEKLSIN